MLSVKDAYQSVRSMRKRQFLQTCVNFGQVVASALIIWKSLMIVTSSESPIVVVLSGSMEPAFHRGDLLFLYNSEAPFNVGEVVVYKVDGRDIPIVHRISRVHQSKDGMEKLLTKGDNNPVDDRGLYQYGKMWLAREQVIGRAKAFLPYVGMVTIMMNDYPQLKWAMLTVLAIYVLINRE
eukprot:TRINITY_DN78_c0_g1_i1.p1 TRINITY_DN78_c0_g1~~TRINITY_DN78_c0_g1_i1.p1  ORF type:complete len:199 (-),score=49.69 TRINITY_DN78_c0_g1_i1:158-697(-)